MERISEKIKQAIIDSGQTPYAIAQATGVEQSTLSRWLRGERSVSVQTLDALALHLGATLTIPRRKKGKR